MRKKDFSVCLMLVCSMIFLLSSCEMLKQSVARLKYPKSFFEKAVPKQNGEMKIPGLESEVKVHFDAYGVPHIYAENERDLFFAQGYITARDRMFQMDQTRRAGRGELSVLFGPRTLEKDKFLKTVGFYRTAVKEYALMDQHTRSVVNAYTNGVNAYIKSVKVLPREYDILGADLEPWRPEDTVVCTILMAYSLTRAKNIELPLYNIGEVAGEDVLKYFLPVYPKDGPTISASEKTVSADQNDFYFHRFPRKNNQQTKKATEKSTKRFAKIDVQEDIPGSTFMIFSGQKTATGAPFFAGSPDLEPQIPALFYLVHLKGGDFNVAGGSLPGVPGVGAVGFNGKIAWSVTNGRIDELDYFVEKLNPQNPDQYLTESGYKNFRIIEETLKIKTDSGITEEKLKVKISRHGPIISNVVPEAPDNTAMQWVGSKAPVGILSGFIELNRSTNFDEFRSALSRIKTLTANMGYADAQGNIGYQMVGSPPIRKKGNGVLPVPGWNGEFDWIGHIPFEKLPYDLNPSKGYFGGFNNVPKYTDYHLTNYFTFERAICFEHVIAGLGDGISLKDLRDLQMNSYSAAAKEWVPIVISACEKDEQLQRYLKLFKDWDFHLGKDSAAATLFEDFYYRMMTATLQDEVGEELWKNQIGHYRFIYIPRLLMHKIVHEKQHVLYDDIRTPGRKETRDDIIRKSFSEAVMHLSKKMGKNPEMWEWGKVHTLKLTHPFGSKLTFLNLKPVEWPGDGFTLCSGRWDPRQGYAMVSGGSIRIVVDFANIENSMFISPPGQSALYSSSHYSDQLKIWAAGEQIPIHFKSGEDLPDTLILEKEL